MSNPLVAGPVDTATPFSGAGILDSGTQLAEAIESGDWVMGGLAAFSTAADTVATVSDPLGTLIGAGLGWLMDHMEPLKGWMNDLTGDAGEVAGFAQTWSNMQAQLDSAAQGLERAVEDLDELAGQAIDAYRRFQADSAQHIRAAGQWAGAMATGLEVASTIVQVVHDLVRDVLSQLVGSAISWAAEAVFTLGLATPWIIEQVSTRVASLAAKVGSKVTAVLQSCKSLMKLLDELKALFRNAGDLFDKVLKGGKNTPASRDGAPPRRPADSPAKNDPHEHLGPDVLDDTIPGAHNVPGDYSPNGDLTPEEFLRKYWDPDQVNRDGSTGAWHYPDNDGFDLSGDVPKPAEVDLPSGYRFDRYGESLGSYTSPIDTPFPQRAIPPDSLGLPYHRYAVVRPFDDVSGLPTAGTIAPWFEQPGGGLQFHLPRSVQWLMDNGYIRELE